MSSFYSTQGETYIWRYAEIRGIGSTIAVWTPTTSTRIVLMGLDVSSGPGGTIRFTFGNLAGATIAEYMMGASSTIYPRFEGIESTVYDRGLFVSVSSGLSDGWRITAQGFELA